MKLLLDTHVFVWAMTDTKKIGHSVQRLLLNPRNEIHVSAVSIMEIAIKRGGGRRHTPNISSERALVLGREAGYRFLNATPEHCAAVESLPEIHGDPYDRLIVAQALAEGMRLVTRDEILAKYSSTVIVY